MATYYVSNSGSDTNNGTSKQFPFETINKVNSVIASGDIVLLREGDTFTGQFEAKLGLGDSLVPTLIASYGQGVDMPIINNYKKAIFGAWVNHLGSVWKLNIKDKAQNFTGNTSLDTNVGHIRVDGKVYSEKKFLLSELSNDWDFYSDATYIYVLIDNPNNYTLEIAVDDRVVQLYDGLEVYNLKIIGTGGHAVNRSGANCVVDGLDIENIGGSHLTTYFLPNVRYGNGIEIWGGGYNIKVENNKIKNVYDTAFTLQGRLANNFQNISIKNNKVSKCSQGFEMWVKQDNPDLYGFINCRFEKNIVEQCGYGDISVGRPRKDQLVNLLEYEMQTTKLDVVIKDNVFNLPKAGHIFTINNSPFFKSDENIITLYDDVEFVVGKSLKPNVVNKESKSRFNQSVKTPQNGIDVLIGTNAMSNMQEEKIRFNTESSLESKSKLIMTKRLLNMTLEANEAKFVDINLKLNSLNTGVTFQSISTIESTVDNSKYAKLASFKIVGQYSRMDWLADFMLWGDSEFPSGGTGKIKIQIVPNATFSSFQASIDIIEYLKMNMANLSAQDFVLVIESIDSTSFTCIASLWFNNGKNNYSRIGIRPTLSLSSATNSDKVTYYNNVSGVLPVGLSYIRQYPKEGTATLASGTVSVQNASINDKSKVLVTVVSSAGVRGFLTVVKNVGSGFTVNSSSNTDNSTFDYLIIN